MQNLLLLWETLLGCACSAHWCCILRVKHLSLGEMLCYRLTAWTHWLLACLTCWYPSIHPTRICSSTEGWGLPSPQRKCPSELLVPVSPQEAAARSEAFHTYPAEPVHELGFDLGKPHTYSHKCIGPERDCRGCGTPGVALSGTPPAQLFGPSLLHWLEALFTPSWVRHHIILPYKNK